jgi:hypothetical protein
MNINKFFIYFRNSLITTIVGLILAFYVGYIYSKTWPGALSIVFLTLLLAILEISLSFDNAVVNASVLKKMSPLWQHRFLTWGMVIAVFGMRIVFPLIIVSLAASVSPLEALKIATFDPGRYANIMLEAHIPVSAFGGAFLLMVALKYFIDNTKKEHWLHWIESPLSQLGKLEAAELGIALLVLYFTTKFLPINEQMTFLATGILGLIVFIAVDGIGGVLELPEHSIGNMQKAGASAFIYLEVLDSSFSFDGVIGSFAITNNLFIIAIGLGIGALFVRSLTIFLVKENTLEHFKYLEHGAFYAILALAIIMFMGTFYHIPESITGIIGAGFIGLSIWSSVIRPLK